MNATAVGLDFSAATTVVFAEVPDTADVLLQAEGRAHRLTSRAAVNVYVLLCKRSRDTSAWCRLADSLEKQAPLLQGAGASPGAPRTGMHAFIGMPACMLRELIQRSLLRDGLLVRAVGVGSTVHAA